MGIFSDILKSVAAPAASFFGGPLLGAAVGAGAGLLGTSKKGPKTTTQQGVPSWLDPSYKAYLKQLEDVTGRPFTPYTGQGVADLSEPSLQGVDLAQFRALNGAPDLNQARGMTMDVTGGKYLNNPFAMTGEQYLDNPYLNNDYTNKVIGDVSSQMARSHAEGTAAQNDAAFNRAGAFGGSGWANKQSSDAEGLARQIGSAANQYQLARTTLGAGDYRSGAGQIMDMAKNNARDYRLGTDQMLQGGQLAGQLSQDDWRAVDALGRAGNTLENNQQKKLDFDYLQYLREQGYPLDMLKALGGGLGSIANPFGTTTQTGPAESKIGNALGGAGVGWRIGEEIQKRWPTSPGIGDIGIGRDWYPGGSGGAAP